MDYQDLIKKKMNRDLRKEDHRQEQSKTNLEKSTVKKMQTIMIGALACMEQNLGFLWGHNEDRVSTKEELELKDLFNKIRNEILDKGNGQIRNFKQELELYKVEQKTNMIQLPVLPQ